MGPGDIPNVPESARAAEVEQARAGDESREALLLEAERLRRRLDMETTDRKERKNPEVKNHGQIAEMTLPQGWVEGPPHKFQGGIGTRSFREIHPPDAPNAMLCFYYRGLPMSEQAGEKFHSLLQQPPHDLSLEELQSLGDVLRDKKSADDFTTFKARTEDVNGKRVLIVEGRYKEVQEDTFEIFVDASGDGRVVQEVYFQAPKDQYLRHARAAKESIKSIDWK